ncbi:hypothetical protein D3C84_467490 [compost metagenome]
MIQAYRVDEDGFYIEPVLFDVETKEFPSDIILKDWEGKILHKPKFDYQIDDWVEGRPFEEILQEHRKLKDTELNKACEKSILSGFKHIINDIEYHFSYDIEAQINFGDAKIALNEGLKQEVMWTVKKDGEYTRLPITKDIMDGLSVAILDHKSNNVSKYRDFLMVIVNSATSIEEINSITWDNA